MIRACLLSRNELKEMILKAPQTKDGYYFFPRFRSLVLAPGTIRDDGYFYDRGLFRNKVCFSITDVKMFITKKEMDVDGDLIDFVDKRLINVLDGLETLNLKDKIPNRAYTLEELIDTCAFFVRYKYA